MSEQPGLFDLGEPVPEVIAATLDGAGDSRIIRASRVGFLAGMFSVWVADGKPSPAQRERFKQIAREALEQAVEVAG